MKKDSIKPIILTVKSIMAFEFTNLIQKLINTPTSNKNASVIHKVYKELDRNAEKVRAQFKETIMEPFALKDEKGKVIINEHGTYTPDPEKLEGYNAAMEKFETQEVEINWRPLTPDVLADVRLTAKEIDLLGPLYAETHGPGVPHLHGVPSGEIHPN